MKIQTKPLISNHMQLHLENFIHLKSFTVPSHQRQVKEPRRLSGFMR